MNQIIRNMLLLGLAVCSACLANARVWTIDGKTKVAGEFSGIMGDIVFLSQANGESLKVHLASLSAEDQAFITKGERATSSVVTSTQVPSSDAFSGAQPIDMAPGGSKPVAFRRMIYNIEPGATVGKIYLEPDNIEKGEIKAPPPGVGEEQYMLIARDELRKAHYSLLGRENLVFGDDESAKARYELGAETSGLRLNFYGTPTYSMVTDYRGVSSWVTTGMSSLRLEGQMTTEWQVYDTLAHKVVYTHTTVISVRTGLTYPFDESGANEAFVMFRKSFRQLLANSNFAAFMKPETAEETQADKRSSYISALELTSFHPETARALPADFSAVLDGVVTVKPGAGFGTGFIITEDGYVLTAAHVVSGLKTVSVRMHSGLVLDADVVRVDDGADVALIKLPGTSHKPLELASDAAAVGIDVYAVGNPASEELSSSVAKGIVSGIRELEGHKFIQTDASINFGNSGGPLMGKDGRVLGIVSSKVVGAGVEGLGFAVPVTEAITKLNLQFDSATAK
jgi:serine protease Do